MGQLINADPFRCRMWAEHERLEEYITEQSCKAEIASFKARGQRIAVLGRSVKGDASVDIELIYGARRLFVARHLNMPLKVELCELSDQEAAVALDVENRQRQDVSPYERGLCYASWLRAKYFTSQEEIAKALRVSPSQISRMLKIARLPTVIVGAFENPLEIRESWGLELARLWQDARRQRPLAAAARAVAQQRPRPAGEQVYELLMLSTQREVRRRAEAHDRVITDALGQPLFRIRFYRKNVAFVLNAQRLGKDSLTHVTSVLSETLQRAIRQAVDSAPDSPPDRRPASARARKLYGPRAARGSLQLESPG